MTDFDKVLSGAIEQANAQVLRGIEATSILASPLIVEFFEVQSRHMVKAIMECDPSNTEALRTLAVGLKELRGLHDHLTQAVTAGLTAAQRLNEQAQGESK